MHGELNSAWCLACDARMPWEAELSSGPPCPACGEPGRLRPDIVWFGEMPYEMERIDRALLDADLFVSIGTSGAVYPAAGFVQTARYAGARTLELNLEPSLGSVYFDESRTGPAGVLVPAGWRRYSTPRIDAMSNRKGGRNGPLVSGASHSDLHRADHRRGRHHCRHHRQLG